MNPPIKIAPSVLAADFANLALEIKGVEEAGCDLLHIDVMDGHFVPNITVGPAIVQAIRRATRLPLDTHLMIERPEKYIESFAKAGTDHITVHAEACPHHLPEVIRLIHSHGMTCGVSLKPGTPLSAVEKYLDEVDLVLLMTVDPGFGGQAFQRGVLPKIRDLRGKFKKDIEVDGGINKQTSVEAVDAGANVLVAGTAIFGKEDRRRAIEDLRCRK